jgi:hypothetical protein
MLNTAFVLKLGRNFFAFFFLYSFIFLYYNHNNNKNNNNNNIVFECIVYSIIHINIYKYNPQPYNYGK